MSKRSFATIRSVDDCSLYLRSPSALVRGSRKTLKGYLLGKHTRQIHNGMWQNVWFVEITIYGKNFS